MQSLPRERQTTGRLLGLLPGRCQSNGNVHLMRPPRTCVCSSMHDAQVSQRSRSEADDALRRLEHKLWVQSLGPPSEASSPPDRSP